MQGRPRAEPTALRLCSMFSLPIGENNAEMDVDLSRSQNRRILGMDLLLFEQRERQIKQPIFDVA